MSISSLIVLKLMVVYIPLTVLKLILKNSSICTTVLTRHVVILHTVSKIANGYNLFHLGY